MLKRRRGTIGKGGHSLPGGHLEWGETFESCAAREVKEETGLDLQDITYVTTVNSIFGNFHYVTIFMRGTVPEVCAAPINSLQLLPCPSEDVSPDNGCNMQPQEDLFASHTISLSMMATISFDCVSCSSTRSRNTAWIYSLFFFFPGNASFHI